MNRTPRQARPHRIFALSWLLARGFTQDRIGAIFAYPACLVFLIPGIFMGRIFESSDTHGMVLFWHHRRSKGLIATAVLVVAVLWGLLFWWFRSSPDAVFLLYWVFLILLLVWPRIIGIHHLNNRATGAETPKGERWQLGGVVQRPGTRISAVLLAWELMDRIGPGGTVVAVAPDKKWFKALQRFGFTPGHALRVYMRMVAPGGSTP